MLGSEEPCVDVVVTTSSDHHSGFHASHGHFTNAFQCHVIDNKWVQNICIRKNRYQPHEGSVFKLKFVNSSQRRTSHDRHRDRCRKVRRWTADQAHHRREQVCRISLQRQTYSLRSEEVAGYIELRMLIEYYGCPEPVQDTRRRELKGHGSPR